MDKRQPIEHSLWALMEDLRRGMTRAIEPFGLTPPHFLVLKALDEPQPMKAIAAMLVVDPSYLTNLADALEANGFLERIPDPSDRRIKLLSLTAAGRSARSDFFRDVVASATGLERLTTAEREQLRKLLAKAYPEGL
jgi:DNA-binding MarR family transcriptional regulator